MKNINLIHNIFIFISLLLLLNNINTKKQINFLSFKEEIKPRFIQPIFMQVLQKRKEEEELVSLMSDDRS